MATGIFKGKGEPNIPTKDILSWIFDAQTYPEDRKIFISAENPEDFLTAAQSKGLICRLVKGFRAAGLKRGDCVLIHSLNSIYYPILVLGIIATGGIFTATNPASTAGEISHHVRAADVTFFISEPSTLPTLAAAITNCGLQKCPLFVFDQHERGALPQDSQSWTELLNHGSDDWDRFDDLAAQEDTVAMRLFSSGTTGLPKPVDLSHRNLVAQHTLVHEFCPPPYETRHILALPMFHAATAPLGHTGLLRSGYPGYVLRRFSLPLYLSTIQSAEITELMLVPTVLRAVVGSPLTANYSLHSVQNAYVGSAPCSKEMQRRFRALMGEGTKSMTQSLGMTECACLVTRFWYPEGDDEGGSIGRLIPGIEAKLVDEEGRVVTAPGVRGEFCVRGPTITKRYYGDPGATAKSFDADGFYHSGDVMYVDEDGKWYIVDRLKELIKVRGYQVAPAEIEGVLHHHPGIADAAVIGVVAQGEEEVPRAYIVKKPGTEVSEEGVKDWVRDRLAHYKRLTGGVMFLDEIPRGGSGKVLKKLLRERAQQELAEKVGEIPIKKSSRL